MNRFKPFLLVYFVLSIAALLPNWGYSQNNFEFTEEIHTAYNHVTTLELDLARSSLLQSIEQSPNNLFNVLIDDYIDFFTIFINQESYKIKALEEKKRNRLQALQNANSESPYYRYIQAEIYLHWTLIYLQEESYWSAFSHVKKAYKLLTKNQQKFPEFIPNYKSLGILHAAIGTVPDQYRGLFSFFSGMKGSIAQGKAEILKVIQFANKEDGFFFKEETYVLYSLLLLHLNNQGDEAWEVLQKVNFNNSNSPLIVFCKANVAMRTGRNDQAISLLENFKYTDNQYPFHYLKFMTGLVLLRKLDMNCITNFNEFLVLASNKNYIKETYQKLGWAALIQNNIAEYRSMISAIDATGKSNVDGDKNAQKEFNELENGKTPNISLLKSRLLFDGGYYQKASQTLLNNREELSQNSELELEYYYRLGRINHRLKNFALALSNYQITVTKGLNSTEYYSCNSALQMGLIYEGLGDFSKARKYYSICLKINPTNYQTSIHLKAKAGLNRIGRFQK